MRIIGWPASLTSEVTAREPPRSALPWMLSASSMTTRRRPAPPSVSVPLLAALAGDPFDDVLRPRVARVEFDGRPPHVVGQRVSGGGLPDARRAVNDDGLPVVLPRVGPSFSLSRALSLPRTSARVLGRYFSVQSVITGSRRQARLVVAERHSARLLRSPEDSLSSSSEPRFATLTRTPFTPQWRPALQARRPTPRPRTSGRDGR